MVLFEGEGGNCYGDDDDNRGGGVECQRLVVCDVRDEEEEKGGRGGEKGILYIRVFLGELL